MKKLMYIVLALLLAACEKSIIDEKTGKEIPADPDWDAVNGYTF